MIRFKPDATNDYPYHSLLKLNEILTLYHGKDYKCLKEGNIPVLGSGGIIAYANEALCNWPCVLIGRKGTIDRPQYMDTPFWCIDTLYYTKAKPNNSPLWQFYLFQTINWNKYNTSSSIPGLNIKTIENLKVNVPCYKEQQEIADFLSTVDNIIESSIDEEKQLKLLRKHTISKIFNQEVRFKKDNGHDYPDWKNIAINDILSLYHGKDYKHLKSGTVPVLGTRGVITQVNEALCNWPCTLLVRKGTVAKPQYMDTPFWCVDTLFYSKPKTNNSAKWQYYLFQAINLQKYYASSSVPGINTHILENIKVCVPCYDEQLKIADFLSQIDDAIEYTKQEISLWQQLKTGLLQQLFSNK